MTLHWTCDGIFRRDFLKVGVLGGAGLTLSNYLSLAAAGEVQPRAQANAGLYIHLAGGPSHLDTFDMKPDAPREVRGTFNPIKTNVPGVEFCEHLPKLAKCADKFAILRGVTHTLGDHALGTKYVNTGSRPLPSIEYPGFGSVVCKETEARNPSDLPPYVSIPNGTHGAGFLGVRYAPLNTGGAPRAGQSFSVRGISLAGGLTVTEMERREKLRQGLDVTFRGLENDNQLLEGLDQFGQQAHAIITSSRSREAFDISREAPAFAKPFGEQPFGLGCLLACRLIESGVRFVTLSLGGWDTHQNNFTQLRDTLLPTLDTGLSALLSGLSQKGLLASTGVLVTGEFGRTPKINDRAAEGGRDHYPRCMFMLLAGGGVRGGQVVGRSDDEATLPAADGFSPADVAATFYHNLGIDHTKEYHTNTGRPITIVRSGSVIRELFA